MNQNSPFQTELRAVKNTLLALAAMAGASWLGVSMARTYATAEKLGQTERDVRDQITQWQNEAPVFYYDTPKGKIIITQYGPLNVDLGSVPTGDLWADRKAYLETEVTINQGLYANKICFQIPGKVPYIVHRHIRYRDGFVPAAPATIMQMLDGDWQKLYLALQGECNFRRAMKIENRPVDPEAVKAILQPLAPVGKEHSLGNALVFQVYAINERGSA
ncbi:MAG: hypothetical protein EYC62_07120 [Alphaproteobacteria bacterium]|nr:MAG: hypothetical protein EYC62_07120 [Alphaproteobacteria bacterium]